VNLGDAENAERDYAKMQDVKFLNVKTLEESR